MKRFSKKTIALVLASVVTVAGAFGANNYKNCLKDLQFENTPNGAINMVLHTSAAYTGNLSLMRRDANTFVLTLPEVTSQVKAPDLSSVSHNITSVNVRTMPYTNNSNGYTRITVKTNQPALNLTASHKLFIESAENKLLTTAKKEDLIEESSQNNSQTQIEQTNNIAIKPKKSRFGTNEIHLADPTQKSYVKEIDKLLNKEGGKKIIIENNNFSIRLCGVNILVSHPELPCECSLQNQSDLEDIVRIIPYTKIDNGVFDGNNWSFLMDSQKNFLPAKEGIKIYEDAEIKMIRNFSLGSVAKTSKWVPGYYYFNEDTVYYYLGTMCTWKIQNSIANTTYGPQKTDETLHMVLDASDFRPVKGQTYNITDIIKITFIRLSFLRKDPIWQNHK